MSSAKESTEDFINMCTDPSEHRGLKPKTLQFANHSLLGGIVIFSAFVKSPDRHHRGQPWAIAS
jgi:hypothetical protein